MDEEERVLDLLSQQLHAASTYLEIYRRKGDQESLEKIAASREGFYTTVKALDPQSLVYDAIKGLLAWEDDDWLDRRSYTAKMQYLHNIKKGRKEIKA